MNTQSLTPTLFRFHQHPVRTMLIERQPWFVAKDLCGVLGVTEQKKAIRHLDEDERKVIPVMVTDGAVEINSPPSSGSRTQRRNVTFISESGMYALVFKSRKPKAREFRKWVTTEVLPAIRSTDRYQAEPGNNALEFLNGVFGTDKEQPAPAPVPRSDRGQRELPAGVLDARAIPTTTVGLLGGKVRMVSVEGRQWYVAADVLKAIGLNGHGSSNALAHMAQAHRAMVQLFGTPCPYWCVTETGVRLILGSRGLLTSQLTLNLGQQ